jgi:exportin-T
VESAIEIAYDPRSDLNLKQQAFEFLSQLRLDPQGWQVCLSIATREPWASEVARHVALDIVNDGIRRSRIDEEGLMFTKERLLAHVQSVYGNPSPGTQQDPAVIQNKIIQAITSLFTRLYAVQWRSFFDDFLSITSYNASSAFDNLLGTSLYLKVLKSIHDEIADVLVQRTSDEQTRDGNLKDLVRERDVQKIAQSWHSIILQWKTQDAGIIVQCLYSIGRWASWTDLSLIIDESLLELMFNSLGAAQVPQGPQQNKLLIASLHTFTELLGKKMKPGDKLELIEIIRMRDVISQLVMSPSLNELRPTSNYDTDFAEDVAKLVNNTVADIVNALEKTSDTHPAWLKANAQLQEFLPFMLRFFSDEYDEICATVIPCLTDLLSYFRKRSKLNPDYAMMLPPILNAIIQKMKYDETSSWGNEDAQTDEAEFQELRKRLQVLQQVVAAVDEPLYIETISTIIVTSLDNFQAQQGRVDWRDLDLAMHEMFLFGELAMKNGGLYNKTKPVSVAAERLIGMMFKLVESGMAPQISGKVTY